MTNENSVNRVVDQATREVRAWPQWKLRPGMRAPQPTTQESQGVSTESGMEQEEGDPYGAFFLWSMAPMALGGFLFGATLGVLIEILRGAW